MGVSIWKSKPIHCLIGRTLNNKLLELAERAKVPLVATNDCHYLNADDVEAHDVLLCIQTQAKVNDAKRMRFEARDLYYKSAEEMEQAFKHIPEAFPIRSA